MKKLAALAVALVLALFAWVAAGPFITLNALKRAIDREDMAAVSAHVDFPAVRSSIRAQVEDYVARRAGERAQDSLTGALAAGVANALSGTAAELLASPAGLEAVMQGRAVFRRLAGDDPRPNAVREAPVRNPLEDAHYRFDSPSRFVVTARNADGAPVNFVLTRQGLQWKVTDVRLPLDLLDPTL